MIRFEIPESNIFYVHNLCVTIPRQTPRQKSNYIFNIFWKIWFSRSFAHFCFYAFASLLLDEIFLHFPLVSIQMNCFTVFTQGFQLLSHSYSWLFSDYLLELPRKSLQPFPIYKLASTCLLSWTGLFINMKTYSWGYVWMEECEGNCESMWKY